MYCFISLPSSLNRFHDKKLIAIVGYNQKQLESSNQVVFRKKNKSKAISSVLELTSFITLFLFACDPKTILLKWVSNFIKNYFSFVCFLAHSLSVLELWVVNILLVVCGRCTEARRYFQYFSCIEINPSYHLIQTKVKSN